MAIIGILYFTTYTDGLCGKTDEDNLGFSYDELDNFIMYGTCGDTEKDKVIRNMHNKNLHKLEPMPAFLG